MRSLAPALVVLSSLSCVACGGAAPATPPAQAPAPTPIPTPATEAPAAPEPPPAPTPIVRFDDLGVSLEVPPGMRAIGDDEIAQRVRATTTPVVRALLRARVMQQKSFPLLTLAKDAAASDGWLTVTLTVVGVPADATAAEIIAQQHAVMASHASDYQVTSAATPLAVDSVNGAETTAVYKLKRGAEVRAVASSTRTFVREGVAFLLSAVWPSGSVASEEEAKRASRGLRFYAPQP